MIGYTVPEIRRLSKDTLTAWHLYPRRSLPQTRAVTGC
jgi:hypothetical protein